MAEHRLGVGIGRGMGGRPDRGELGEEVGAQNREDCLLDRFALVRVEDSGIAACEQESGDEGGLPPVGGSLGHRLGHHHRVHRGPQEAPVVGAAREVGGLGTGFLQHFGRRPLGRAARYGGAEPAGVRGVRGFVDHGAPGHRVVLLVPGPLRVQGVGAVRGEQAGVDLEVRGAGEEGGGGTGTGTGCAGHQDVLAACEFGQALGELRRDPHPLGGFGARRRVIRRAAVVVPAGERFLHLGQGGRVVVHVGGGEGGHLRVLSKLRRVGVGRPGRTAAVAVRNRRVGVGVRAGGPGRGR
ncbi:hypothetical protein ACFQ0Q_35320 [Streptomyces aureus]